MKYGIYLFAFAFLFTVAACGGDDNASSCDTTDVTYTNTVKSIFESNGCTDAGCHPATNSAINFSLASYADYTNYARKDQLVGAINWDAGFQQMPRDSTTLMGSMQLADCDIQKIEAWVDAGSPE